MPDVKKSPHLHHSGGVFAVLQPSRHLGAGHALRESSLRIIKPPKPPSPGFSSAGENVILPIGIGRWLQPTVLLRAIAATTANALGCPHAQASVLTCTVQEVSIVTPA